MDLIEAHNDWGKSSYKWRGGGVVFRENGGERMWLFNRAEMAGGRIAHIEKAKGNVGRSKTEKEGDGVTNVKRTSVWVEEFERAHKAEYDLLTYGGGYYPRRKIHRGHELKGERGGVKSLNAYSGLKFVGALG